MDSVKLSAGGHFLDIQYRLYAYPLALIYSDTISINTLGDFIKVNPR
jgi:hypothetical protein